MENIEQDEFLHNTTIDNFMLDSSVGSIPQPVPRQIVYPSNPPDSNIDNHCKMPTGDILYHVNNIWMDYSNTSKKCCIANLIKYTKKHELNQVYGTAAKERNKKNFNQMVEKQKKRNRSETRSLINRLAKTNTTKKKQLKTNNDITKKINLTLTMMDKEVTEKVNFIFSHKLILFVNFTLKFLTRQ